jgi:Na+/proline symporter
MVFMAAMTTGDTAMAGIQALLTVDLYKRRKRDATQEQQMKFGRWIVWPIGVGIAIFAVLMEGVSLLYIDIVSGIIFAAPVGILFFGTFWERPSQKVALTSLFIGFAGGITAWLTIPNQDINWFWGNVISLCAPIVFLFILSALFPSKFTFDSLKNYKGLIDIPDAELEGETS